MPPAELLLAINRTAPVRVDLVWMDGLDLIIQTDRDWPIDTRAQFTLTIQGATATGTAEVRACRPTGRLVRCRVVRIAPADAQRLRDWQADLPPEAAVPWFDNETTLTSTRRGRSALNEALRGRVRRLREPR